MLSRMQRRGGASTAVRGRIISPGHLCATCSIMYRTIASKLHTPGGYCRLTKCYLLYWVHTVAFFVSDFQYVHNYFVRSQKERPAPVSSAGAPPGLGDDFNSTEEKVSRTALNCDDDYNRSLAVRAINNTGRSE